MRTWILSVVVLVGCITETNPGADDGGVADASADSAGGAGGVGGAGGAGGGVACESAWEAVPGSVAFGAVPAFEAREITVDLRNTGECILRLAQVRVDGPRAFGVELDGVDPRVDPAVLEAPIEPGAVRTVVVTYTAPAEPVPAVGTLVVASEAGELAVALSANSGPCLRATPEVLSLRSTPDVGASGAVVVQNCGATPIGLTGASVQAGDGVFSVAGGVPATLTPGSEVSVAVSFVPTRLGMFEGQLNVETDSAEMPVVSVGLLGLASENACPVASVGPDDTVMVELGQGVALDGSASLDADGDGRPVRWEWVVVQRPEGSTAPVLERLLDPEDPTRGGVPDDPSTPEAVFVPDLLTRFVLELRVTDAAGCQDTAQLVINSVMRTDIEVQLTWEGAGDLDLHLRHPSGEAWSQPPFDCYYGNANPDWGQLENPLDDPSLNEDLQAEGPEIIRLAGAENTEVLGAPYRVGVSLGQGEGVVRATVRVLLGGELAAEVVSELSQASPFWDAAEIAWPPPGVNP